MEFLRLGRAKESRWLCDPKMSESPVFQPLFNSYSQLYSSNNTQAKEMAKGNLDAVIPQSRIWFNRERSLRHALISRSRISDGVISLSAPP